MDKRNPHHSPASLRDEDSGPLVAAYLAGDPEASGRLSAHLTRHARITVRGFLRTDSFDTDDLVQDTVVSVLGYLERRGGFRGSLVNFTISVARNRCRNWLIWKRRHPSADAQDALDYLSDPKRSPLELLAERETLDLLRQSLDRLEDGCRSLLRALYIEGHTIEEVRRRSGLSTVQAIYYRRTRCLESLGRLLKIRLRDCSSSERGGDG